MFKVEIKNLSINTNIGITAKERKQKQINQIVNDFIKGHVFTKSKNN